MAVLEELTRSLDYGCEVRDIRQGVLHTAVLTRNCGLAATLLLDAHARGDRPLVSEPGTLHEKSPRELVDLVHSTKILEAAIGLAAINSLLTADSSAMVEKNAGDIVEEKGAGKNVAVVGHFPFIPFIRKAAANVWVIENNPKEGDMGPEKAAEFLPRADVVAATGTSLTNHTFEGLMKLCAPKAYVIVLGGSVPFSPLLFDYGVDAVCGTLVTDPDKVLRCVGQGANFRQITGVRRLTMFKDKAAQ